jgi:hypothetical protein
MFGFIIIVGRTFPPLPQRQNSRTRSRQRPQRTNPLANHLSFFCQNMLGSLLSPASRIGGVYTRLLATSVSAMSFYTLSAVKGDGSIQDMADFKGKVVYATNVASM